MAEEMLNNILDWCFKNTNILQAKEFDGKALTEDMAYSVTTAERHIFNFKAIHDSFDRFLCKIKVPGVIFASKSAVGLKINVKVPK